MPINREYLYIFLKSRSKALKSYFEDSEFSGHWYIFHNEVVKNWSVNADSAVIAGSGANPHTISDWRKNAICFFQDCRFLQPEDGD